MLVAEHGYCFLLLSSQGRRKLKFSYCMVLALNCNGPATCGGSGIVRVLGISIVADMSSFIARTFSHSWAYFIWFVQLSQFVVGTILWHFLTKLLQVVCIPAVVSLLAAHLRALGCRFCIQ